MKVTFDIELPFNVKEITRVILSLSEGKSRVHLCWVNWLNRAPWHPHWLWNSDSDVPGDPLPPATYFASYRPNLIHFLLQSRSPYMCVDVSRSSFVPFARLERTHRLSASSKSMPLSEVFSVRLTPRAKAIHGNRSRSSSKEKQPCCQDSNIRFYRESLFASSSALTS